MRRFPEVGEFAVDVHRREKMDEMEIRVEVAEGGDPDAVAEAVAKDVRNGIGLRIEVTAIPTWVTPKPITLTWDGTAGLTLSIPGMFLWA